MLRKHQRCVVTFVVLMVYMMALIGEGFAEELGIKLVVNPSKTDVYLGTDPIALTARVKGKNLVYDWKLLGPGKLEGKGSSVFYVLPEKIEGDSEQALITVTVKDETGEEITESVTFNIIAKEKGTGKGMSKTTKIALGVGAAAALGGGIALIAGGGDGGGDGDGDTAEYSIVGRWNSYNQYTPDGNLHGDGDITFTGSTTSGTFTRIDYIKSRTHNGTYTVENGLVTMTGTDQVWTGTFVNSKEMTGTWYLVSDPDTRGNWAAWKE